MARRELTKRANFIGRRGFQPSISPEQLPAKKKLKAQDAPFSMKSIKQRFFNEYLLKMIISNLDLEQSLINYQDTYEKLAEFRGHQPLILSEVLIDTNG